MHRCLLGLFLVLMIAPLSAAADVEQISRRDGFLLIWNSIRRPALENREKPFTDVTPDSKGFAEITYAKYRGIVSDADERFHPDEPLVRMDALLWLFRTRSVGDVEEDSIEHLQSLLERYPLHDASGVDSRGMMESLAGGVTENDLLRFMRQLDEKLAQEDHEVSLYSEKFHGKGTAFGETFDMHAMTAAHRTFPHNTLVKVTNLRNGKSVTVRINDRGPFVEGRDMDLSLGAFTSIEDRSKGVLRATFQRLGDATLVDQCGQTSVGGAVRITKNVRLIGGIPWILPLGERLRLRSTRPFVLRSVRYPDGTMAEVQNWVLPGESHDITPSIEGEYLFTLGAGAVRRRDLRMEVIRCDN